MLGVSQTFLLTILTEHFSVKLFGANTMTYGAIEDFVSQPGANYLDDQLLFIIMNYNS